MTVQPLDSGQVLHGYAMSTVLGVGGSGFTYAATCEATGGEMVVKEYFPHALCFRDVDNDVRLREVACSDLYQVGLRLFLLQMRKAAQIVHPHVVAVTDIFESGGSAYAVMPRERGRTLDEVVGAGRLDGERGLREAVDLLLLGLQALHAADLLHQDIKLENLRIRSDGIPVLVDLGSLRLPIAAAGTSFTVPGTQAYAPVEHYRDEGRRQGPASDIYGFAVALYAIVTGKLPPDALSRWAQLRRGGRDLLESTAELYAGRYSSGLLEAVDRGLAFEPEDRPPDVAAWRAMFSRGAALDVPEAAVAPEPPTHGPDPATDASGGAAVATKIVVAGQPQPPGPEYAQLRILIVDDERFMRSLLTHMLERLGIVEIVCAENGRRAMQELLQEGRRIDLILSDLVMDDMDGVELIRALADAGHGAGLVIVSGVDARLLKFAEDLARSYSLNVIGRVGKPPSPDALGRLIDEFLADQRAAHRRPPAGQPDDSRPDGSPSLMTAAEFEAGLEAGALVPYYQPKVAMVDRSTLGVEALARWSHARHGILGPAAFIPWAELSGNIEALTRAMLRTTIADLGRWIADGYALNLAVNVSADCLLAQDLPDYVEDLAAEAGVPTSALTLEVTETQVAADLVVELDTLIRLRLKGICLSIDDFGTGFSSMQQLNKLPFTELKIDQGFVTGAAEDEETRAILQSSVALARKLNLHIVAEGVETAEDWAVVEAAGCDTIQGYYVAKPMSERDLRRWLLER